MRTRSAQSTTPAFNTPSRVAGSATTDRASTDAEAFAIEGLLQMQAQPTQSMVPPVVAVPPPSTSYVPSVDQVRTRTANPPTFGSTGKNILDLSDETWESVTPGKRELLGIVAWLVARFGKNSDIVLECYQLLPYIREPPSYPALPLGWEMAVDELGRRFYVNLSTGASQWCRPKRAVSGYVAPIPCMPRGFPYRTVTNKLPTEAAAQSDTPRPEEVDPEWRPRWPTTMPDTSTPRRSQRIRTMSERSSAPAPAASAPAAAETETTTGQRTTRRPQPRLSSLRRSTRLASRA